MAQHRVQAPDGTIHIVEAPEGASPDAVVSFLAQSLARQKEDEPGFLAETGRSFVRGVGRTVGSAGSLVEDAPAIVQSAMESAHPIIKGASEYFGVDEKLKPGNEAWKRGVKPAAEGIRNFGENITGLVAPERARPGVLESLGKGEIGEAAATGVYETVKSAPTMLAAALAARFGGAGAGQAVLYGSTGVQEYDEIRDRQKREGIDDVSSAVSGAAVASALEGAFGPDAMIAHGGLEAVKKGATEFFKRVGKSGLEEGITEFLQTAVEQFAGGSDPLTKASLMEDLEASVIGAFGGTSISTGVEGVRAIAGSPQEEEDDTVPPPPQQGHDVDIITPDVAGEGATPSTITIMGTPDEHGIVPVRKADGSVSGMTLDEIEALRAPAEEGTTRRSVAEELADTFSEAKADEDVEAEAAVSEQDDPEFDETVSRIQATLGIPHERAVASAEAQLGRRRGQVFEAEATPAAGPVAQGRQPEAPPTPDTVVGPTEPEHVIKPIPTPGEELAQNLGQAPQAAPTQTQAPQAPPITPAPKQQQTPDATLIQTAQTILADPNLLKESAKRQGISVPKAKAALNAALEEMGVAPAPEVKPPSRKERTAAAKQAVLDAIESHFPMDIVEASQINQATQQMVLDPELSAPQALANALGVEVPSAQEEAAPPAEAAIAAEPAVVEEPVVEPMEAPEDAVVPEEVVPVTKVAPAPAKGIKEAVPRAGAASTKVEEAKVVPKKRAAKGRGSQGATQGRPVEGAAQVTQGMKAQQALDAELEIARHQESINDNEMAFVREQLRIPTTNVDINKLDEDRRGLVRSAIRAQKEVDDAARAAKDVKEKQVPDEEESLKQGKPITKDSPEYARAKTAHAEAQKYLDKIQEQVVERARSKLTEFKKARAEKQSAIKAKLANPNLTAAQRTRLKSELREAQAPKIRPMKQITGKPSEGESRAITRAVTTSETANDIVQWLIDNAPDGFARTISKKLMKALERLQAAGGDISVHIVDPGDRSLPDHLRDVLKKSLGVAVPYSDGYTQIVLNSKPGTSGLSYEVLQHEMLHGVTASLLDAAENLPPNDPLHKAGKELQHVLDAVNDSMQALKHKKNRTQFEDDLLKQYNNARNDVHELLAWTLSNPEMREYLNTVPYSPSKTIWTALLDAVRAILGYSFNEMSALAEVLSQSENLLSMSAGTYMRALESNRQTYGHPMQVRRMSAAPQSPETSRKINSALHKAQVASDSAGFLGALDENSRVTIANNLSWWEQIGPTKASIKSFLRSPMLYLTPSSVLRDLIGRVRTITGQKITELEQLEQKVRGARSKMQEAGRHRIKEFRDFVNKHGQKQLAAMMNIARVARVDVTSYASFAEAQKKDKPLREYARQMSDPNASQSDRTKAKKGYDKRLDNLNVAWRQWDRLGQQEGGQELYKRIRQWYKDAYAAHRLENDKAIKDLGLPEETEAELLALADGLDPDSHEADPNDEEHPTIPQSMFPREYFPFRRFGQHVLRIKTKNKANRERHHFETAHQRDIYMAKHAKEHGLKKGTDEYNETYEKMDGLADQEKVIGTDSPMYAKMVEIINKTALSDKNYFTSPEDIAAAVKRLKDQLYQTYLMTLPEASLRKQYLHANLVAGQSADVLRVFTTSVNQYAGSLPKAMYGRAIQRKIEEAYDTASEGDPDERNALRTMLNIYVGRLRDTMDPANPPGWIEKRLNEYTFGMLMTSMASALAQTFTIPTQVMPRMLSRYGPKSILKMTNYVRMFGALNMFRGTDPVTGERSFESPTLGNLAFIKSNPLRKRMWDALVERDAFSQKQGDMLLVNKPSSGHSSQTLLGKSKNGYSWIINAMGKAFGSFDQISREMTGMAFAELEYEKARKAGKSPDEAFEQAVGSAVRNTDEVIGNYSELERPNVFRGNMIGRMMGFLRTFAVQRIAYYFRMLHAIFSPKGSTHTTRIQATTELASALTFSALTAGIPGVAGYGVATMLINAIMGLFMDDDDKDKWKRDDPLGAFNADYLFKEQWLPVNFGSDSLATRVMRHGALSVATGADFSTRLSQNNLLFREGRKGENLKEDILNWLVANVSPHVSMTNTMLDGVVDMSRGEWEKGVGKIVPAAIRGPLAAHRYATEGEKTRAGRPVMAPSEFSDSMLIGQGIGFTPLKLARQREMNRSMQGWQYAMKEKKDRLIGDFRKVYTDPDSTREDIMDVVEDIRAYNRTVPRESKGSDLADPKYSITMDKLGQSLKSAENITEDTYRGTTMRGSEPRYFYPHEKWERQPAQ